MDFVNCHLLHWSYEKHAVPAVLEHIHSYYQIELCVNGVIKFNSGKSKLRLHSGEWMLIPPGTPHSMTYEGKDLEYYSLKFAVNNLEQVVDKSLIFQPANKLSAWIISALVDQRPPDQYLYMPINENRVVLETLLLSMLQQALSPIKNHSSTPRLLREIANIVAEEGAMVNAQLVAGRMQMNVAQLKYRYELVAREHFAGAKNHLTLKQFFDRELMKQIDRFLFYSDLALGEISAQTKFNNIYTFSRFVKRLTGQTPTRRRAEKNPAAGASDCNTVS